MNTYPDIVEFKKSMENEWFFLPGNLDEDNWMRLFSERINHMVVHDFEKLVSVLYQLDVSEAKIKEIFKKENDLPETGDGNAGTLIAGLIIERQLEKLKTRRQYRNEIQPPSDQERW